MFRYFLGLCLVLVLILPARAQVESMPAAAVYYVSSSGGNDSNPGTQALPFKTIARVNQLQGSLQPGDQVLFKCGDSWRGERLTLTHSGTAGSWINYSSYPPGCGDQPVLAGTQVITDWVRWSGNIFVADLSTGGNAGKFLTDGINQLFRDGKRIALGRWPNINAGDGGYSTVDAQSDPTHLTDNELPAGDWRGATIHLKVIRWSIVNRTIASINGKTLQLNTSALCAFTNSNCSGWGYFINNSLNTLDLDGEWFYDKATHKVCLFSLEDPNSHLLEGSVVPTNNIENLGLINLGAQLGYPVSYLIIDNFKIIGGYKHGIASPTNLTPDENAYLTLQNNRILDVDADGINLWTWVYGSSADDWRGGNHIAIINNLIDGANHFGIHTPSQETTIESNTIRNIALIQNLNDSGMGCGITGSEGTCTEDGTGLRIYYSSRGLSGYNFTIRYNRFENIGGGGVMNFGYGHLIQNNVFRNTCISKGDCGAINTFGGSTLDTSPVHDITISENMIFNTLGNTDGTHPNFRALFAFGLYIDSNSRAVSAVGNTIAWTTVHGILYQNSTGIVQNNTLFDNVSGSLWGDQTALVGSASLSDFSGNILVSRNTHAFDLGLISTGQIGSANYNRYDHSAQANVVNLNGQGKTLAQWQALSGKDAGSVSITGTTAGAYFLIYNETRTNQVFDPAGWPTCDLNGAPISAPLTLPPFSSRIVYHCGPPAHWIGIPLASR